MSRSGDRSYSWRGEGRDREIAPTAIRDGEYVAIGRYTEICRDQEIAPTVGEGYVAIRVGEGKLCMKTEDIANCVRADGQHRVHIILLRLLRLKGNRS